MEEFYVLITASDSELKEFAYLPLKSNHVYKATNSIYKDSNSGFGSNAVKSIIAKTYYDVIVEDFGVVKNVHKRRLKVLTKQELRELNLNNLIDCPVLTDNQYNLLSN